MISCQIYWAFQKNYLFVIYQLDQFSFKWSQILIEKTQNSVLMFKKSFYTLDGISILEEKDIKH